MSGKQVLCKTIWVIVLTIGTTSINRSTFDRKPLDSATFDISKSFRHSLDDICSTIFAQFGTIWSTSTFFRGAQWFKSNYYVQLYARLFGVHRIVNYKESRYVYIILIAHKHVLYVRSLMCYEELRETNPHCKPKILEESSRINNTKSPYKQAYYLSK